jgi:hypothetical protein
MKAQPEIPNGQVTVYAGGLGHPEGPAFGGVDFDELFLAILSRNTMVCFRAGREGQTLAGRGTS